MPSSQVMHKFKHGKLHSGSKTGKKVTNPAQAKAILMSEKRNEDKHGGHYSHKKGKRKMKKGSKMDHDKMLRKMMD